MRGKSLLVSGLLLISVSGCTTYYKVTDPTTNRTYYSTEVKQDGSTTLKDARTGNTFTLQKADVEKISEEDFEAGKSASVIAPPVK
ncbi:MAG TPA: hypothetical protein VH370_16005 [Humisphaera sp.]|jgi:hypothetical protein|nr:hypothetical protein [Humisphaera sp.]